MLVPKRATTSVLALTAAACLHTCAAAAPQVILMILADDLGYGDLSYLRNTSGNATLNEHYTPHIDQLAQTGVILSHHYTHFYCTPSRCSLLSGRLPMHVQQGQAFPETPNAGIPRNMTTIGTKMQQAGYRTHVVGKWDVGMATPTHTPEGRGFDSSLIYYEHMNDYWTQQTTSGGTACNWLDPSIVDLWDSGAPARSLNGTKYIEYLFADRMSSIIANHNTSDPLFIYYAPHTVHYPLEVPEEWYNKYSFVENDEQGCNYTTPMIFPGSLPSQYSCRRQANAMVALMDQVIGNITTQLQARGMWNNTLVVFASDNGAPLDLNEAGSSNTPLRGGKYASWEGGIRTPAFVSGGYVPPELRGTSQDGVVHIADWYATFCGVGGVDPADPVAKIAGLPPVDSVDVWPLISGANSTWPRVEIPVSPQALISWPYKLITGENAFASWQGDEFPNSSSTEDSINPIYNCSNGCLFDLSQDSNEHTDISANNPNIVQSLSNRLNALVPGFFTNNDTGIDACPSNITLLCGCWMATHYWGNFLGPFQH